MFEQNSSVHSTVKIKHYYAWVTEQQELNEAPTKTEKEEKWRTRK